MEELTVFLASYDIVALNVLLPCHGSHVRDGLPMDWFACSNAIHKELLELKQWCRYVFLIGHSLGGALCLHVAASEPVTGIVTICEPIYMFHYWPLLRAELPSVTAPVLIMTAIHDRVVSARDAQAIYRLIGSQEKYLVKFRRSYHLLMDDSGQEVVFARTLDFIQSHTRKR
jgi:carboxylesterase